MAGLGVEQSVSITPPRAVTLHAVFAWRRDRADFLPADRVVTHTRPPSETREWTTDRETTVSQTFEIGFEAIATRRAPGSPGETDLQVRGIPAIRGRLLVQLPDKYPDRDLVFHAAAWGASARLQVTRALGGRIRAGFWVSAGHAGAYRRTARLSRDTAAAGVLLGMATRR